MVNTKYISLAMAVFLVLPACAQAGNTIGRKGAWTAELRQRSDHVDFPEFPFVEGDMSYLVAYEYREADVFWQLGLDYSADPGSTSLVEEVSYVMTPQVGIYWVKEYLWGGVGVGKSYVKAPDSFWTGFYWQLGVGVAMPVSGQFEAQVGAYYIFDDWGDLGDFTMRQMEYGFGVTYYF